MLAVMYNTILGLCYSFAARFTEPYSKKYHIFIIIMMIAAYVLSFVGFADLINVLYIIYGRCWYVYRCSSTNQVLQT